MGPPTVSIILVVGLGLTATLYGPTMVHAEGGRSPGEDTSTTTNMTRVDSQCSPLQRRQDLLDSHLSTHQHDVNTRFNRMDGRLDVIETLMSDMKDYLQKRMESMEEKVELGLTDISPHGQKDLISYPLPPRAHPADFRPPRVPQVHRGCQEALARGWTTSGAYSISLGHDKVIDVYCEQRLDGGGWMVIQARKDGSVNFYRDWNDYKLGFGELWGEFRLGNSNIHMLTKQHDQQLKIELISAEGEVKYADYSHFSVDNGARKFRINVTGYVGGSPPGDSMVHHQGQAFSTRDQDNDEHTSGSCAEEGRGGWWYKYCNTANLNGLYGSKTHNRGLNWETWKGNNLSMNATRMMIRKRP